MSNKLVIAIAGAIHIPLGPASAFVWLLFSALFVPICPHFGPEQPVLACRAPAIAIDASLAISVIGLVLVVSMAGAAIVGRLRRRRAHSLA